MQFRHTEDAMANWKVTYEDYRDIITVWAHLLRILSVRGLADLSF
jgi:hypothetical protein